MWNPLVFRKLTKSWNIDQLLPFALSFYMDFEKEFNITLIKNYKIARLFSSVQDQNNWTAACNDPEFKNYASNEKLVDIEQAPVNINNSYGVVQKTGRIDLPLLMNTYRNHLLKHNKYYARRVRYNEIQTQQNKVKIEDMVFDHLVFCEGHQHFNNPWFIKEKIQNNKGELLTIHAPELKLKNVINKGFFLLPVGEDMYKLGATFSVKETNYDTTENARQNLIEKLEKVLACPYKIVDQQAGIRPTVHDRRPVIGLHREYPQLGIFNGMGTKAVSIVPLMAEKYANHLLLNEDLPNEVKINRFN